MRVNVSLFLTNANKKTIAQFHLKPPEHHRYHLQSIRDIRQVRRLLKHQVFFILITCVTHMFENEHWTRLTASSGVLTSLNELLTFISHGKCRAGQYFVIKTTYGLNFWIWLHGDMTSVFSFPGFKGSLQQLTINESTNSQPKTLSLWISSFLDQKYCDMWFCCPVWTFMKTFSLLI